jgi:hypothetical protein
MNKTKNNLNKTNSSGWLDNYSEDFSIDKYAEGGGVWEDIKEELNTEVVNPIKNFFFPKETKKKVYTDPKTLPKSFNLQDNRKINPITKKALNPTKDLKNFKGIDKENVQAIIKMADYLGYPRDLALAVSLQESGLGKIDDNLGHNLDYYFDPKGKNELFTEEEIEAGAFITGLKEKANYAKTLYNQKKIPKNDLIYQLQAYNGFGKLNPNTEIDYYENPNQKFYGVDVKGNPLSLKDNPLYGKTIINFRDSIINQDPTLKKFLNLPKYYEDGGPIFKKIEVTSPSDNTRRTIDSPINLMTKEQLRNLDKATKLKANEEKAQIANRNKRIKLADKARKEDATIENMALRASVLGDRMRFFPNENNIIDDLNPLRYIGDLAGNVGQIPLNIKEGDYSQAALNLATPMAMGAIGGIGTQNTGQFVNNLINPLADISDKLLKKQSVQKFLENPRFDLGRKEFLPESLSFDYQDLGDENFAVLLRDPNNKIQANLSLFKEYEDWYKPGIISVKENLQGHKIQDILYQKGIEEVRKKGLKGIRSGDYLMEPEKTIKAQNRFIKENLLPDASTQNKNLPIVGLLNHKNPNLYEDFFAYYATIPKEIKYKHSIKELYDSFKNILPGNKSTKALEYLNGGTINNNMKNKKTKKYPAGGYLNYQEGYKGFGMGPELYQDNSYFRSVMPDNIEDMEEMINKPSVFSGINDVLGSVNQGVNQVTGLMSKFQNPQTGMTNTGMINPEQAFMQNYQSTPGKKIDINDPANLTDFEDFDMSNLWSDYFNPSKSSNPFPSNLLNSVAPPAKNGGYLKKYQDGGEMDMLPVGAPEYIHKSNVFNEQYNPVPRVHFSDDTTAYDMGVNLNDLVNMNGGRIRQYAGGGFAEMYGNSYGGASSSPRLFNANTGRATLGELQAATQNDFLNTKVRNDRQQFVDDKVDWGAFNFLKQPAGFVLGRLSEVPIVGNITKSALGDSFLTRTKGYTVGSGVGKTITGVGKIAGGIATGNVGMVGSGIGDVGSGVGSTYGNLAARDAMSDYNKSGYVSNKRLEKASQDFGNMMDTASGLFGNIKGGVGMAKNMGGMEGMFGNMKGGQTGMKGFGNFMGNLTGFRNEDGGMLDYEYTMVPEFKKGGLTPSKAEKMLHDKSFTTDKQRKYFGYIASQNKKTEGGWLDSL